MVSLGDTAISLHILQLPLTGEAGRGVFWKVKTQSAKIYLNFNFQEGGGGVFWEVKTQSAKICLNFNFQGGDVLGSQNPKCQDLPKFQFSGGGMLWEVKTQSAKICLNFNFLGGGGILFWNQIPEQVCSGEFGQKFSRSPACLRITDVETNNIALEFKLAGPGVTIHSGRIANCRESVLGEKKLCHLPCETRE